MRLYMILNATEAVYQWLLFLRGKNGGIVRNHGFSTKKNKTLTFIFIIFLNLRSGPKVENLIPPKNF